MFAYIYIYLGNEDISCHTLKLCKIQFVFQLNVAVYVVTYSDYSSMF